MKELTKERLEEIRSLYEGMDRIYYQKEVNDLLEHINFLESIINDMGCDGIMDAYKRGREKGIEQGKDVAEMWMKYLVGQIGLPKLYEDFGVDKSEYHDFDELIQMLKEGKIRRK